ncbi:MAG: GNAT family N-acetyltransferase [Alphaproteobacteria bacterium]|nr:GNAT family N-acetyltransferase [Alphaproteobacteria bacterium]
MTYSCRTARKSDLADLVRLLADDDLGRSREKLTDPLPAPYADALSEIIGSGFTQIIVVESNGVVAGSLQLTMIPHLSYVGQRRAIFESVHVAPEFQNRSAGTFLVRYAIDVARSSGCGQIVLTSSNSRADAHRFWKRMGFIASHVGMKLHLT